MWLTRYNSIYKLRSNKASQITLMKTFIISGPETLTYYGEVHRMTDGWCRRDLTFVRSWVPLLWISYLKWQSNQKVINFFGSDPFSGPTISSLSSLSGALSPSASSIARPNWRGRGVGAAEPDTGKEEPIQCRRDVLVPANKWPGDGRCGSN